MAYHQTPASGQQRGEARPVSLLFTPAAKTGDGQKATPDYRGGFAQMGRSPSTTPGGFPGSRQTPGRERTPPSRRRSLTPASSMARDTPPPPPATSLLDSPATAGPGAPPAWAVEPMDVGSGEGPAVSPLHAARQQQQRELAAQLPQHEDTWVTVFGFTAAEVPLVLREFGKCGDIEQFGTFGEAGHVNWMHINYSTKYGAQRALLRSGDLLARGCMVGVKPLVGAQRAAVERGLQAGGGGPPGAMPLPRPAPQPRPYALDGGGDPGAAVVPLPARSTWAKLSEFVFGL